MYRIAKRKIPHEIQLDISIIWLDIAGNMNQYQIITHFIPINNWMCVYHDTLLNQQNVHLLSAY
jgi:hypothetical protein